MGERPKEGATYADIIAKMVCKACFIYLSLEKIQFTLAITAGTQNVRL